MVDYSRFDSIGDSSDEEGDTNTPSMYETPPRSPPGNQPPTDIMEDLEDYFRRLEERRSEGGNTAEPVDVERFSDVEFDALSSVQLMKGAQESSTTPTIQFVATDETSSILTECAICLCDFQDGETLIRLPCAAGHMFHRPCIRAALAREFTSQCHTVRLDYNPVVFYCRLCLVSTLPCKCQGC